MARLDKRQARNDTAAPVRIGVVATNGGLAVAIAGLVDVFAVANRWVKLRTGAAERCFELAVLGTDARGIRSFSGYDTPVDAHFDAWAGGDVVLCSAVAVDPVVSVGENAAMVAWLAERAKTPGITMASVCTGAFFLAEAGLLAGRRATTNPLYARAFAARYPDVRLELARALVDEGPVLTAGTVAAGLNLALYLVERYAGVEVAALTARSLALEKNRESQAHYLIPAMRIDGDDELTAQAQRWIEAHHADAGLSLARVARALAVTTRTLERRFAAAVGDTPMGYARLVRIEAAKRLLESTEEPIEAITRAVGYGDARSFARLFRAQVGIAPGAYRARFGRLPGAALGPAAVRTKPR
jgi:transcriptional regulator GlxA family with amidase domain